MKAILRCAALAATLLTADAAHAQYAWVLIKQPEFKARYLKLLGTQAKDKWLASLHGPSDEGVKQRVGDEEYLFVNSCKPHACDSDHIVIAYNRRSKQLVAKLRVDGGEPKLLGAAPDALRSELEAYYAAHFAQP